MLASAAFRDGADRMATRLACPLCTYEQQQVRACYQDGEATLVLEFEGGCGCCWQLRLERVETHTRATVQIMQPCLQPSGLQAMKDPEEAERLLDEYEL